ncbi:MAG: hypothetical protein K2N41_06810 [Lachnospiraceae bacterium]|nr:hypothetical protein [Lachnospiraceae bacterium]MDE7239408.1 hypothetical protein [Lachnospiraceae bacterium]
MTVLYSILHLLVDGVCAMAMFGTFIPRDGGYFYILLYNFCAFALQMPFGVVLDALHAREEGRNRDVSLQHVKVGKKSVDIDLMTAVIGVLCTIAGAVTHPIILGIGNALFHVGGGVGTIRDRRVGTMHEDGDESDCRSRYCGNAGNGLIKRLGVFVAPGALGLYVGTILAKGGGWNPWFLGGSALMLLLCGGMLCFRLRGPASGLDIPCKSRHTQPYQGNVLRLTVCCLLVVILRSYIGMAVSFPWKTGVLMGVLSVLAVVGGKMAGGFLSAWEGSFRTAVVSLILAAVCYLFSSAMPLGLAALFLFNMTMPITLYWMVCAFSQMPGFAFGCLTFALFLGFLPGYLVVQPVWTGNVIGGAGSILSLLLLAAGIGKSRRDSVEAACDALCLPAQEIGKNRCDKEKS